MASNNQSIAVMNTSFISAIALRRLAQATLRCTTPARHATFQTPTLLIPQSRICRAIHSTGRRFVEKEDAAGQRFEGAADVLPEKSSSDSEAPEPESSNASVDEVPVAETSNAAVDEVTVPQQQTSKRAESFYDPELSVFVSNLNFEITAERLTEIFSQFGNVLDVRMMRSRQGAPLGYSFVKFDSAEAASRAMQEMNEQELEGRRIYVKPANGLGKRDQKNKTNATRAPTHSIFIGNLNFAMTDKDLNDLFKEIPNITKVRVAVDRTTGQPRGFAHADFIDVQSAREAINLLNEKVVQGRSLRVNFADLATHPDKRVYTKPNEGDGGNALQ